MRVAVSGDIHGKIGRLYACVEALEREVGARVDLVLQVGDFGVWPDRDNLDDATRRHGDTGEFERLLASGAGVPRPTAFIAGNHEDFDFLLARGGGELVPGLRFMPWGSVHEFEARGERVRVGAAGGCYGPRDYARERLSGTARRHYTARDLERLARATDLDVLLLHEPPGGAVTELHAPPGMRPRTWQLQGEGLADLVAKARPRVCFTGHIHARTERSIAGVRTVGLHILPRRGSVLLVEIVGGEVRDLAEWDGAAEAEHAPDFEAECEADAAVEGFLALLVGWGAAVRGDAPLDRDARKRLHAALAHEPYRAVLMGAAAGHDVRALLAQHVPADERAALLASWQAGGLPSPDGLARGAPPR